MRILRLDIGEHKNRVEMHPLVTVVQNLDQEGADSLLQHIRSLARGSAVGVCGLIEDQSNLLVLEGDEMIALSHVTTVDVVVDSDNHAIKEAATSALQAEIDQLQRQADIDAAQVEEIRAQLDPTVKSRLARLRRELQQLVNGVDLNHERQQELETALEQSRRFDHLVKTSAEGVSEAIQAWEDYQAYLRENQEHVGRLSEAYASAQNQLAACKNAVAQAEQAAQPVLLTQDEEARLYELEELREQKSWRDHSPDAAELDSLLNKVGVTSWTGYTMHRMSPTAAPERVAHLEECRKTLRAQEQQSSHTRKTLNNDPIVSELESRRTKALELAQQKLGQDIQLSDDIHGKLRSLEHVQVNPEWLEAQKDLLTLLQTPGFGAPEDVDIEGAQAYATSWLKDNGLAESEVRGQDRVRQEIVVAERVLGRHNRAMAQMDRVEQRAASSKKQIARIFAARDAAEARGAHHTAELLSYIRSVTEEALWEASRAIPVAVTGSLEQIDVPELMSSLELLAQKVQVIVVSANPAVADWASSVGAQRALLTQASVGHIDAT